MKTRLFSLVSAVVATTLSVLSARAADVTPEQASLAAQRWVARSGEFAASFGKAVSTVTKETVQGTSFYVAKMQGSGVIVLSSDTTQRPVIFALPGTEFQTVEQNPAVKLLVTDLKRTLSKKSAEANEAAWRKLVSTGPSLMATTSSPSDIRVPQLVTTQWSQTSDFSGQPCFNLYTPTYSVGGSERSCVAGCVPIATAQTMNYFRYPAAYPDPMCGHYVDFKFPLDYVPSGTNAVMEYTKWPGETINWNLMQNRPGAAGEPTTTSANREAIGKLCYNVGAAGAAIFYEPGATGGQPAGIVLAFQNFGYSNAECLYADQSELMRVIRANLNAKRPLCVEIPYQSHQIVCDGYGYSGNDLYIHLNMGWMGSCDTWYSQPPEDVSGTADNEYNLSCIGSVVGNIYTTEPAESVILSGRVTGSAATVRAVDAADPSKSYTGTTDAKGVYALLVPPGKYLAYIKVADSYSSAKAVSMAAGIAGDIDNCDFVASAADKASAPVASSLPTGYTRVDWVKNAGSTAVTVAGQSLAPGQKISETLTITDANGAVPAALIPVRRASDGASGFVDALNSTFSTDAALISRLPGDVFALPSDYTALEYIASTGEQYINTGYAPKATDRIDCVVNVPSDQGSKAATFLYGTTDSWAKNARTVLVKHQSTSWRSYVVGATVGDPQYANHEDGAGFYGRKIAISDVGETMSWSAQDGTASAGSVSSNGGDPVDAVNPLLIFNMSISGDAPATSQDSTNWAPGRAKLYSFTITDTNGNKVRDYIPCKNASGTVGLWDKAEGEFVTSATSAAFHPPLPMGYEEVEFIRSTPGGNQYINTKHCPTDKTRIVATVYEPEQTGATGGLWHCQECDFVAMFGSFTNGGPDTHDENWVFSAYNCCAYFLKWWSNAGGQDYMRYKPNQCSTDGIQAGYGNLPAHNTKRTYEFHPTGFRIDGGDWWFWNGAEWVPTFATPPTFTSAYPLYIFGANQDGTFKYPASMRLYGFKIYEGAEQDLVRDFVPCRNEKGEAGLYDHVTKEFYGNANTAAGATPFYTTAEDVLPDDYKAVDFIESDGTQYIDTEYMWNYYTRIVCDMSAPQQATGSQADGMNSRAAFGSYNGYFGAYDNDFTETTVMNQQYTFYLSWWNTLSVTRYTRYGFGDWDSYAKERNDFPYGQRVTIDCYVADNTTTAMVTPYGQQSGGLEYRTNFDVGGEWASATCPFYIFAANANGKASNYSVMRLYGFKIYEGETLMRDYVPCKKPDGTAGLWDKVRGAFVSSPVGNAFLASYGSDTLPEGYGAVEYIESTGSQYIDTGYYHNANTRIECTLLANQQTSGGNFVAAFGSHRNWAETYEYWGYDFYLKWWGNAGETGYTRSGTYNYEEGKFASNWDFPFGQKVTITCDNNGAVVMPGNVTYAITGWNDASGRPFYIFAACCGGDEGQADGPECFSAMKLYGFKIYDGATLKRDLVPCRNPDGVAGLFDMVYGKFYSSSSSTKFLAPWPFAESRLVLPNEYTALEYIESTGSQYIDTSYTPLVNTKVDCTIDFNKTASSDHSHAAVFGVTASGGFDAFTFFRWNGENNPLYVRGGGENAKGGAEHFYDRKINLVCEGKSASWTVLEGADAGASESVAYTQGEPGDAKPDRHLYIFAFNESDNNSSPGDHIRSVMKLYSFKISENGQLVRDFLPCRNASGVAGLYDPVTERFYANAGTGAFIGSDEIPLPTDEVTVRVPMGFFNGKTVEGQAVTTLAQKQAYLYVAEANGLKAWQNYAMGVDGTVAANAFDITYTKTNEANIVLSTPIAAFNAPAGSGLTVTYTLMKSTDGGATWSKVATGLSTPTVSLPVTEIGTGDSLWKFKAVFVAP